MVFWAHVLLYLNICQCFLPLSARPFPKPNSLLPCLGSPEPFSLLENCYFFRSQLQLSLGNFRWPVIPQIKLIILLCVISGHFLLLLQFSHCKLNCLLSCPVSSRKCKFLEASTVLLPAQCLAWVGTQQTSINLRISFENKVTREIWD